MGSRGIGAGSVALAGLALVGAASWAAGAVGVRLGPWVPAAAPVPPAPAEALTLHADDGSAIAATYWPGRRPDAPGILLVPGLGTMHRRLAGNAAHFAAQGYAVLAFDMRGHGASGPARHGFGWTESADAHAAFAWLKRKQRGAAVAAIGISMGGAALLVGPRGPVPVDAMVLQAVFADIRRAVRCRIALVLGWPLAWLLEPLLSYQSWPRLGIAPRRLSPLRALAGVPAPVLVVAGARDPLVPPAEAQEFHDAAPDARGLWVAPRLGHIAVSDASDEAYRGTVLAFLHDTVGTP